MAEPSTYYFPIQTPISNERVKLIPFDADLHSTSFIAQTHDHPELFAHMPSGPYPTVAAFQATFTGTTSFTSRTNPAHFVFAVIDKTRPPSPEDDEGELAGLIAYLYSSDVHLSTEIGPVITLPRYQRSHVTTNAVGLLMKYAFASPETGGGGGGLGLRRIQWNCSTANLASAKVAERIGYEKVGLIPFHYRFIEGKKTGKVGNGKPAPPGGHPDDVWRDTLVYSMSWDVWESGARDRVEKAMSR